MSYGAEQISVPDDRFIVYLLLYAYKEYKKRSNMKWTIEDGSSLKQVRTIEDIATTVKNVMEGKSEYIILSPSIPVETCNFMQAVSTGIGFMHIEVSLLLPTGKNRTFSQTCTPDVAIRMFTTFFTENMIPDVTNWMFEGEFG